VAIKLSKRDNLIYLTLAMLVLLFLIAVAEQTAAAWGRRVTQLGVLSVLVVALWTVRGSRGLFRSGLGALGVLVLLTVVSYWLSNAGLRLAQLTTLIALLSGITWFAFRRVLFTSGSIDANRLLGAVSIYLLLGLIWAIVYAGILEFDPSAFNGDVDGPWLETIPEFVYFSFVTLTTLGYGDISPATPIARFVVYLEAILGQLYLATMVAGLVGVGIADRMANRSD
jgi:voltage-gated potassium channel Kch